MHQAASPRAGMPSWNPFSRGRSPRAARERLASARALAESTRDLRAAAADEGAAKPTPDRRAAAPDSDVVARYKAGQAKVIADASK